MALGEDIENNIKRVQENLEYSTPQYIQRCIEKAKK